MARKYQTALVITGDAKDGVQAIRAAEHQLAKLDQQSRRTIATNKRMSNTFSGMRVAALGAAGGIAGMGAAMAGGMVVRFASQAVSVTADLGDMADATNVSAEKLQELQFAMRQFNPEAQIEDATEALITLADHALDAVSGTQSYVQAFNLIGISVDELRGKDPVQLFKLFAEAIQNTDDSAQKMTAATRIFGDDLSLKLLPLLSRGADGFEDMAQQAHEAGAVLSSDLVDSAQQVDKQFSELTQTISTDFKWAVLNSIQWVQDLAGALDDMFNISEQPLEEKLAKVQGHLAFMRENLPKSAFQDALRDEIAQYESQAANLRKQLRESGLESRAQAVLNRQIRPPASRGPEGGGGIGHAIATSPSFVKVDVQSRPDVMTWGEQHRSIVDELRASYASGRALTEAYRQYQIEQINKVYERRREAITQSVTDQAAAQRLSAETEARRLREIANLSDSTYEEISQYAIQASRNIESAFADYLFDPFAGGLDGMLKGFTTTLRRMAAEQAASGILDSIGSFATDYGKSNGGAWGSIASAIGSFFGGGKATGGPVSDSKFYVVGERGPELFAPRSAGTIIPNHAIAQQAAGTAPVSVTVVNNGQPLAVERTEQRRGPDGEAFVEIHVAKAIGNMVGKGTFDKFLAPYGIDRQGQL